MSNKSYLGEIELVVPGAPAIALEETSPEPSRRLDSQAMRWSYVLRNRQRWLAKGGANRAHEADAVQTLADFGVDEAALTLLAAAPCVVVRMPYRREGEGWEGRVFPWEYVIAAATRQLRAGRPCTVLRELDPQADDEADIWPSARRAKSREPLSLLFVQSAPGGLREPSAFDPEYERMRRVLPGSRVERLVDPTLQQLADKVLSLQPDLVHLSGFGNASGLREWRELAAPGDGVELDGERMTVAEALAGTVPDGMLLAGSRSAVNLVSAQMLARALSADGRHCAYFIGASLDSSAARTAAMLVAERAALSAVGFQNEIDNMLLDMFFELFYGQLASPPWHAPLAFQQAWLRVRAEPAATRATGIAFWSGAPLSPPGRALGDAAAAAEPPDEDREPYLECAPEKELNYAVLHNNGRLFEKLVLMRGKAREGDWLGVDVELHLGAEPARCSRRFQADKRMLDLAGTVMLPLTAELIRSVQEAVNSTLVVQLSWNQDGRERLLSRETYPLRLLPVDQWRDNDVDGQWLPSFVLPRDPAVLRAVEQAQRYVRVLRDNPAAGFEGYQAAPNAEEEELREVDLQVQAIWATLLHDWQLGYINPPPSYSSRLDSQRLRTPSTILGNRSGTCIDLALLFAACLELIDVHPVVFLLHGHALPGYWRHHSYRETWLDMRADALPAPVAQAGQ
uniref:hypothetical protein n=1 Tax=Pelomonas sp. KK5 TaxID=1855730 RepID=UPI00097CB514